MKTYKFIYDVPGDELLEPCFSAKIEVAYCIRDGMVVLLNISMIPVLFVFIKDSRKTYDNITSAVTQDALKSA